MNRLHVTTAVTIVILCLVVAGTAAAAGPAIFTTHTAEGDVYVNSSLARQHPGEAYLPLVIGVVNNLDRPVRLTRESFAIQTAAGTSPAITVAELRRHYGRITFDRRQIDSMNVVAILGLQGLVPVPSNFYPIIRKPNSVETPIVELPRRYYTWDVLYFKRPAGLKPGDTFTVVVTAEGWKKPVRVKVTL